MSSNISRTRNQHRRAVFRRPAADDRRDERRRVLVRQQIPASRAALERRADELNVFQTVGADAARIHVDLDRDLLPHRQFAVVKLLEPSLGRRARRPVSCRPHIPQVGAQRLARARQARFDGPDRQSQGKRDLFVAQSIHLPQHDRRPLFERQPLQRTSADARPALSAPAPGLASARARAARRRERRRADRAIPDPRDGAAARTGGGCAPGSRRCGRSTSAGSTDRGTDESS